MGKNFETKKTILESLSGHSRTLTDLSRELALSPSTVKQHLQELREMGLVRFVDDVHLTKWKYYERVPSNDFGNYDNVVVNQSGRRIVVGPMSVR